MISNPPHPSGTAVRQSSFALTIPRQHGAWAMLLTSAALGVLSAGPWSLGGTLLLIPLLAGFLARHCLSDAQKLPNGNARRKTLQMWAVGYGLVFVGTGSILAAWNGLWLLLPIGVFAAFVAVLTLDLEAQRRNFTAVGEAIGLMGLSLAAPAVQYAASGVFSARTAGVWLVCVAFLTGGLFRVRYLVRRRSETLRPLPYRLRAGWPSAVFHGATLAGMATLGWTTDLLPPLVPLAFVPAVAVALWSILRRYNAPIPIRRIGRLELVQAVIFMCLAAAAYRVG